MLDDFDDIRLRDLLFFERLAELGTITAAARHLGIPKPTASRWLTSLEERVGQPLVIRGTRQAVLTERGRAFLQQIPPLLASARALRAAGRGDRPGGVLRVSVPVPLGRLVGGSVIAAFRSRLPGVRLEILLQNTRVDLVKDRVDLAIRGGPLPDSSLMARPLARVPLWLYSGVGSIDSTAGGMLIAAPGDEALLNKRWPSLLPAVVVVDDRTAVRDALQAGAGVGVLPAFLGEQLRGDGGLLRLDDEPLSSIRVHAVYLPEQRDDIRVQELIDLITKELKALLGAG